MGDGHERCSGSPEAGRTGSVANVHQPQDSVWRVRLSQTTANSQQSMGETLTLKQLNDILPAKTYPFRDRVDCHADIQHGQHRMSEGVLSLRGKVS